MSARSVAERWRGAADGHEAYSKQPSDQAAFKTLVTPKSDKGLSTKDYETDSDSKGNDPDVARLPQTKPEVRTKERGRALPNSHRKDRDREIGTFVVNVPDAEPDSRSRTKTKTPVRTPGTPGEEYGHPTKYDFGMPTRRGGLKKPFPQKRQKNQGGVAKRYYQKHYRRNKSRKKMYMRRRFQKLKKRMLYKRDQRYREQYPKRYERRGIGYTHYKNRSKDWRKDKGEQPSTRRKKRKDESDKRHKKELAKHRKKRAAYEWNLPAYLETDGRLDPIDILGFNPDTGSVLYGDPREDDRAQTLKLDAFLSRFVPSREEDIEKYMGILEEEFGDAYMEWDPPEEEKEGSFDTFYRVQDSPGSSETRRDRAKYHPDKMEPGDPAHRGQPFSNPTLQDRGQGQPHVEQQSGSSKVIPDRNNSSGQVSWRNRDKPTPSSGFKVAGMKVKWGAVPPQWVYATKVPGYETLTIGVEGGGLYAEAAPVRRCKADLESLSERVGQPLKPLVVQKTFLPEEMRGKGLGKKLYEMAAREAAKKGYALAPNDCWHGGPGSGMTSPDARRVWASLRRQFVSEGLLLWGGQRPASSQRLAAMHRSADTIAMIRRRCAPDVIKRSKSYAPALSKFEKRRLTWRWKVGKWKVSIRAVPSEGSKALNVTEHPVRVSCSCPFYRWQGPEHWGEEHGYQYGRPRGTATFPVIRDPKFRHAACKHAVAVFDWIRSNKLKIPEDMRRLRRYSPDRTASYEKGASAPQQPDPKRLARRFLDRNE